MNGERTLDVSALPVGTADSRALLWWGNLSMMLIEGTMFVMLIAAYLYYRTANLDWPPTTVPNPDINLATTNLVILLISGLTALVADRAALRDSVTGIRIGLGLSLLLMIAFMVIRVLAVSTLGYKWSDHAYGSICWTMIGMHQFHVFTATCEGGLLFLYTFLRPITKKQLLDVRATAVYWYFVVLIWIPFYFIVYVMPFYSRR